MNDNRKKGLRPIAIIIALLGLCPLIVATGCTSDSGGKPAESEAALQAKAKAKGEEYGKTMMQQRGSGGGGANAAPGSRP